MPANYWIYLSPHPDDAVFSCGGLIWEQAARGEQVEIWTICAGDVPSGPLSPFARSLHERWQTGVQAASIRRDEDRAAARILGAGIRHFDLPDCIYRSVPGSPEHKLYTREEDLFGPLHPLEEELVHELAVQLEQDLSPGAQIVLPLALGNHVDHQLVRRAGQAIGRSGWYYPDFPYALQLGAIPRPEQEWQSVVWPVSDQGLHAWQAATATYHSQISTFWSDIGEVYEAIRVFARQQGGVTLWRRVSRTAD